MNDNYEVSYEALADFVGRLFSSTPYEIIGGGILFGLKAESFTADVEFKLFDYDLGDGIEGKALRSMLWFAVTDDSRMDFSNLDFSILLELCYEIQNDLTWTHIFPYETEDSKIEMGLYASTDIQFVDLEDAISGDLNSPFMRFLKRMIREWRMLNPIMAAIASGQIDSPENISLLMVESDPKAKKN